MADPEVVKQNATVVFGVETIVCTISNPHAFFEAYVQKRTAADKNAAGLWRLYVTPTGGVRTKVAESNVANDSKPVRLSFSAVDMPAGNTYELCVYGLDSSSGGKNVTAVLVGYDYSAPNAQSSVNGTVGLPINQAEVVLATLNLEYQAVDISVDTSNLDGPATFIVYVTPSSGVRVPIYIRDFSGPVGKVYLGRIKDCSAPKYEVVGISRTGKAQGTVTADLTGSVPVASGGGGGTVLPMAGDVINSTADSVISKIRHLAGGGTRLLAVENDGTVIAISPPALSAISPDLGDTAGDILVTITGTNLISTQQVHINNTLCTDLEVVNDTAVRCRTPALAAGTYDVDVSTLAGSATLAAAFESWNPIQLNNPFIYDSEFGITQVAGLISQWVDQGAVGYSVDQATVAQKPLYQAGRFGGGRRHAVSSDGTNNATSRFLDNAVAANLQPNGRSMFCIIKTIDTRTNFIIQNPTATIVGQADNNEWVEGIGIHDGDLQYVSFNGATFDRLTEAATINDGQPHVIGLVNNDATGDVDFWVDGTKIGTQNTAYSAFYGFRTLFDGFTAPSNECFNGECGAIVLTPNELSNGNVEKLTEWMFGRFVQEESRFTLIKDNAPWAVRDGAPMLPIGTDLYILGGWDPANLSWPNDTTNEVWKSSDGGVTWNEILTIDVNSPLSGPGARWQPRHVFPGLTHVAADGVEYLYVIGGDQTNPNYPNFPKDVWRSADGVTWTNLTNNAEWGSVGPGGAAITGRMQHMCWSYNGKLYLAGGQSSLADQTTAMNDVWRSDDDGLTWTQLADAPWAGRGAVTGAAVMGGFMWLVAGGAFSTTAVNTITYREVWKFDGVTWTLVTNTPDWLGRIYNFCTVFHDQLYLIGGANGLGTNFAEIWASSDGATWIQKTIVPWQASHADGICVLNDKILQGPGNGGIISGDPQVWNVEEIFEPWP